MERPINELHKGETLQNGKYKILDVLGKGGFGITYLAEHSALRKKVAIKELFLATQSIFCSREENSRTVRPHFDDYEKHKSNFANEATTLARFSGKKGVVQINDTFSENNTVYFVMDYIEGDSLKDIVTQRGALSEKEAIEYILQILYALKEVHAADILHRDIKPDNLIVRKEDKQIILIDFGIAREFTEDETQTQTAMISVGYAPPEQKILRAKRSASMDLYSVGAVLYFCLTSQRPQTTDEIMSDDYISAKQLNSKISQKLSDFIDKAIDKKPSQRFQSASEMISFLENYDSGFVSSVGTSTTTNNTFNPVDSEQTLIFEESKVIPTKKVEEQKVKPTEKKNRTPIFIAIGVLLFLFISLLIYGNLPSEYDIFIKAQEENTRESYEKFLSEYPDGRYKTDAEEKINTLDTESWQIANDANDKNSYLKYKEEHPNGQFIKKADSTLLYMDLNERYIFSVAANEGLIVVRGKNTLFGYVDTLGNEVIPLQYEDAGIFSKSLAMINKNGKWGFINTKSEMIIPLEYDDAGGFSEKCGLASVNKNGKWGFINTKNEVIIPLEYDKAGGFSEKTELARVKKNGKYGFINKQGKYAISSQYDSAYDFYDDVALVMTDKKWHLIDKSGKVFKALDYEYVFPFREGFAAVATLIEKNKKLSADNIKCGFIDTEGNETIHLQYEMTFAFNDGIAPVKLNDKWGFIDETGKNILYFRYDELSLCNEGMAPVKLNNKWMFIDKDGKQVIAFTYDKADIFVNGLAEVKQNGKEFSIDKKGECLKGDCP